MGHHSQGALVAFMLTLLSCMVCVKDHVMHQSQPYTRSMAHPPTRHTPLQTHDWYPSTTTTTAAKVHNSNTRTVHTREQTIQLPVTESEDTGLVDSSSKQKTNKRRVSKNKLISETRGKYRRNMERPKTQLIRQSSSTRERRKDIRRGHRRREAERVRRQVHESFLHDNKSSLRHGVDTRTLDDRLLEDHEDPEVSPDLYQGDMMGVRHHTFLMSTRVGINWEVFPELRWNNGTVPYAISNLYDDSERLMIQTAINTLNFLTCVKFVPWDKAAQDYILIWPVERPRGCWSYVGKRGGQQMLSLQKSDAKIKGCFPSIGKPIHELLHALGVFHEQSRPDRDDYVDIVEQNIVPKFMRNFAKQSAENTTSPFTYDYNSVMHYGSNFFSIDRSQPTIIPKKAGVKIGQRIMLSKLDCLKVNYLYNCFDDPEEAKKYTALCKYLGY